MTIQLSAEELDFLKRVGLSAKDVFDASNLQPAKYRPLMKANGATVAWGVNPCRAHEHQLRDSHGHCVMCAPACLSHAKRYHTEAIVYVAYSKVAHLAKVGYSNDLEDRARQLNGHKVGNSTDWTICESFRCKAAGRVEKTVQQSLAKFRVETSYGAKQGDCDETFKCGRRTAVSALRRVIRLQEDQEVAK